MSNYRAWCERVKQIHEAGDAQGARLDSANNVERISIDGLHLVRKGISSRRMYVPRLKALGEMAYALFDYCFDPLDRVTPNVYAPDGSTVWREWIDGQTGDLWRADLHSASGANLKAADRKALDKIRQAASTERIALLDMIFLVQDRSARNWVHDGMQFWAIDNGMLWPFRGRHADKRAIKTMKVDHLCHPITDVLVHPEPTEFKGGIFSAIHAGNPVSKSLQASLKHFSWPAYFDHLSKLIGGLDYPASMLKDWRFGAMKRRAEWIVDHGRLPTYSEADEGVWDAFIYPEHGVITVWHRGMEVV